ncbi:methylated-DNA-[protein]-cysteine S-methyltransferase [Microbacterium halimionae]|uniref:methylated-DNA--[protein]-cysteine S-methyltransferase n=1 Tax=Microbacterium halimionae TaxID=1526413 RepID=A0A7W3PLC7_9MICO|nr:methylated-DNA--[protein]-cysteine S-methyltransferase [Microbacterium halimionae]MBA8815714.1 methylated-DNA-[protein]-cysteine S-methyltransferase [Microbacterium halimionae]NII95760.1 methylated-DNA-[protein]-cysteine S-methyltransferase [Microbacterium halimionae]
MTPTTYSVHSTPIGDILLVHSPDGLVAAQVLHAPLDHVLEPLAHELRSIPRHDADAGQDAASQLDEYFAATRKDFDLTLDWQLANGFTASALKAVCEVPYGETASYAEVAALAGSPRAHRAVGTACRTTPFSVVVPVHRVVRADGSIGEYGGHPEIKRFLLDLESGAGE